MSRGQEIKPYYDFESLSVVKETKNGLKHRYIDEHGNEQTDTNLILTHSMLTSKAYKDLKPRQRQLYAVAKDQFFGARRRPSKEYPSVSEFKWIDGKGFFFLNFKMLTDVYGLYKPQDTRGVYADIKALIEHGFIEKVTSGHKPNEKGQHESAIYKYSDKWKTWERKVQ